MLLAGPGKLPKAAEREHLVDAMAAALAQLLEAHEEDNTDNQARSPTHY